MRPAAGSTTGLSSPRGAKEKSKSFRVSLCRPLPIGREVYRAIPKFQEKLILVDIISCLFICFASKWTYHPAKKPSTCWILGPTLIGKRFTWNLSLKTWTSIQWFSFQVQDPFRPFLGCLFSHHEAGEPVEPSTTDCVGQPWKAELEFHCSIAASSNGLSMMSLCDVCNNDLCGMCAKNDWKDLKGPKCFATLA